MSFNPLYEQIDWECAGAPVRTPEPENATPGVPGLPVTSPADATPALPPRTTAKTAAATNAFVRIITPPSPNNSLLSGGNLTRKRRARRADFHRLRAMSRYVPFVRRK